MAGDRVWPDPWRTVGVWDDPAEPASGRVGDWLRPERDQPPPAARPVTVAELALFGADAAPSIAAEGADRILGPYAIDADRETLLEAVALAAFLIPDGEDTCPVDRALRDVTGELAVALRAARWAPLAPWRVTVHGDTATVTPVLVMGVGAPSGPIPWRALPALGGARGDFVFARLAPAPGGFAPIAGFALPEPPDGRLERLAAALEPGRPPTTEGTLRARGHTLLRRLLECEWATTTTRTPTR